MNQASWLWQAGGLERGFSACLSSLRQGCLVVVDCCKSLSSRLLGAIDGNHGGGYVLTVVLETGGSIGNGGGVIFVGVIKSVITSAIRSS